MPEGGIYFAIPSSGTFCLTTLKSKTHPEHIYLSGHVPINSTTAFPVTGIP